MKKILNRKMYIVAGILCFAFLWLNLGMHSLAFTRTTGEVTGSSVKVRATASTDSNVVASVRSGDKLDVTDAVNGSDGKVWYKIIVSAGESGYIRSDFVNLDGGAQTPSADTNTNTNTNANGTAGTTVVTPMDEQNGHTNTNNVKVRQQASTTSAEIDRLNQDVVFTISGTAEDSNGKTWYQVTYIDNGTGITGFIRSDLVTLIEKEQEPLEETVVVADDPDEEEPEVPQPSTDYEAVYTTDESGNYVWYLYDRTAGKRYKIDQLMQVKNEDQEELDKLSGTNFGLKIALIISICLLIMLIVAVVFYILKMKEEAEEESEFKDKLDRMSAGMRPGNVRQQGARNPQQGTRSPQQGTKTVRQGNTSLGHGSSATQSGMMSRTKPGYGTENSQKTEKRQQGENRNKNVSWKAKNFLEDNDEFEFGFLDFDEDDE